MDGAVANRFVMHENKNGGRRMVPALRPAVKNFCEVCQELSGRRRRLQLGDGIVRCMGLDGAMAKWPTMPDRDLRERSAELKSRPWKS